MNLNFLQRKTYWIWRKKGDSGAENGMITEYRKNNLERKTSKEYNIEKASVRKEKGGRTFL
jgi:hypothetical protein